MTLAIDDLTVRYRTPGGDVEALTDVSLSVGKGQTLALVGESGSGKSTVALAVDGAAAAGGAGRRRPDPVRGRRHARRSTPERARKLRGARIGAGLPGSVLGAQPVAAHRRADRRGPRPPPRLDAASAALARCGRAAATRSASPSRAAVASAYPHELSGGMRQRALIAGALAAEPDLLILDEPTTALDVTIEAQILDLLEELQARRGLTMLFISHNLGVVRRIADEVAVLYAGQVVEQGATADVLRAPLHPYTKGLLAADPAARRAAAAGSPPFPAGCPTCARRRPAAASSRAARSPWTDCAQAAGARARRGRPCAAAGRASSPARVAGRRTRRDAARDARRAGVAARPSSRSSGCAKTFTLSRGLAALAFEGWRPRLPADAQCAPSTTSR